QPDAGCVEYRIRDRGRNDRGGGFARTPGFLGWPVDQFDHDLRHLREFEDRIALPVEAGDLRTGELHFLHQCAANGLDDVALDLVLQTVGIDYLTAVVTDVELRHSDAASRAVNFDLGDRANIGAHQLVFRVADAASLYDVAAGRFFRRGTFLPLGPLRHPAEHLDPALVGWVEIFQTEFQRVGARRPRPRLAEAVVARRL